MIQFHIFGIRVDVEPWFWLTGFVLGGGIHIDGPQGFIDVGLWMLVCFVSILVHELGHALTGRRLGGGLVWIRLWAFGGLAYNQDGRFSRNGRLAMILAGPGAGFALFGVTVVVIFLLHPGAAGLHILDVYIRGSHAAPVNHEAYEFLMSGNPLDTILSALVWINLWWGLVNLLPVHPLDGGQAVGEFMTSRKNLHTISLVTAVMVAVFAWLAMGDWYVPAIFGFMAYSNYKALQESRF